MTDIADGLAEICREAGRLVLARGASGTSAKAGHEVVTAADWESEEFLRQSLGELTPGIPVVGEEGNDRPGPPPFWLVDPLDGTTNFAHGYPVFSVSAALFGRDGLEVGCVFDPSRHETFLASRGAGASLDGRRISCSGASDLGIALLATGFPYSRTPDDLGFDIAPLLYFLGRVQGIRRSGSAALDLCYVACGRLDGYWEQHLRPWDMAAGVLIATESGAIAEDYSGGPWSPGSGGILAGAPGLFGALRKGLRPKTEG